MTKIAYEKLNLLLVSAIPWDRLELISNLKVDIVSQITVTELLLIPYAHEIGPSNKAITRLYQRYFAPLGFQIRSIQDYADPQKAVEEAAAILLADGSLSTLMQSLQQKDLIQSLRNRLASGTPCIGIGAGAACLGSSAYYSYDYNVEENSAVEKLGLLPFNICPNFAYNNRDQAHSAKKMERRINAFLMQHKEYVLGLNADNWIQIKNGQQYLKGYTRARLFRYNAESRLLKPGEFTF